MKSYLTLHSIGDLKIKKAIIRMIDTNNNDTQNNSDDTNYEMN